jgi:hypothetical protein
VLVLPMSSHLLQEVTRQAEYRKNCETPGLAAVSSIEVTRRRYGAFRLTLEKLRSGLLADESVSESEFADAVEALEDIALSS